MVKSIPPQIRGDGEATCIPKPITDYFQISTETVEVNEMEVTHQWASTKNLNQFFREWLLIDSRYLRANRAGVYMIGDFYIGKSIKIRERVGQHIKLALKGTHINQEFQKRILEKFKERKPFPLTILSRVCSREEERRLILQYKRADYPLTNIEFLKGENERCLIDKTIEKYENEFQSGIPLNTAIADLRRIRQYLKVQSYK